MAHLGHVLPRSRFKLKRTSGKTTSGVAMATKKSNKIQPRNRICAPRGIQKNGRAHKTASKFATQVIQNGNRESICSDSSCKESTGVVMALLPNDRHLRLAPGSYARHSTGQETQINPSRKPRAGASSQHGIVGPFHAFCFLIRVTPGRRTPPQALLRSRAPRKKEAALDSWPQRSVAHRVQLRPR